MLDVGAKCYVNHVEKSGLLRISMIVTCVSKQSRDNILMLYEAL